VPYRLNTPLGRFGIESSEEFPQRRREIHHVIDDAAHVRVFDAHVRIGRRGDLGCRRMEVRRQCARF